MNMMQGTAVGNLNERPAVRTAPARAAKVFVENQVINIEIQDPVGKIYLSGALACVQLAHTLIVRRVEEKKSSRKHDFLVPNGSHTSRLNMKFQVTAVLMTPMFARLG